MTFLYNLTHAGVDLAEHPSERRGILLSNIISLILFSLGIALFLLYLYWYGWSFVTVSIPVIATLCLVTLLLNYYHFPMIGRVWVCVFVPVITLTLSIYSKNLYYDVQEELDYFTFRFIILASCVFPAILFSMRERTFLILTSLVGFAMLMLHDPLHTFFGVPYQKDVLKESNYAFTNVVVFITYCIMTGAVIFLKSVSEKSENKAAQLIQELNRINEELTEKNSEIEAQNTEILSQTENLNASQQQLHAAYRFIEEQKDLLVTQNKDLSSELLEKNRSLTDTNTELIKHNNELRQFSFTVSHNLRGPVASLLGLISLIDQRNLNENEAEIFSHIKSSTVRLDTIVKDLSKIIDIRHDIFQIRQKINLEREAHDVKQTLKRDIETHDVTIETQLHTCRNIYSVKPMVHSILYNLVSNAIKYHAAERKPVIRISARESNTHYVIEVTDNGLGIDLPRNQENLFKLYKRFHYHTEGKGIGLYLVKLQTEALGGTVEVKSEVNRYTTFIIYLRKPENIERQILYQEPHAEIFYDAKINCVGTVWNGPLSSEQYRSTFKKCLDFVKAYNTPNYIADISNQGALDKEDQHWMFTEILPEAARNGLTRMAGVNPDATDPLILSYMKGIHEHLLNLGVLQKFFVSMKEAVDWIQEENEKASLKTKS
jgi:signal transduction histidine kinase